MAVKTYDITTQRETITHLCGGNIAAAALIEGAWRAAEAWDHAHDGDPVTHKMIDDAFLWAMFQLHDNPVYVEHPELRSALLVCIANWQAANQMEASNDREQQITAYILRSAPYDWMVAVVFAVTGSMDAAIEAALYFRRDVGTGYETLDQYLAEHVQAGTKAEG